MKKKALIIGFLMLLLFILGCTPLQQKEITPSQENNNSNADTSRETTEIGEIDFKLFRDQFRMNFGQEMALMSEDNDYGYYVLDKAEAEIILIKNKGLYIKNYQDIFNFSIKQGEKNVKEFIKIEDFNNDFIGIGYNHRIKVFLREVGYTQDEMVEEIYILLRDNSLNSVTANKILEWNYVYCAPNVVLKIRTKAEGINKFSYTGVLEGVEKAARGQAKILEEGINGYPVENNRQLLFNKVICPNVPENFNKDFSTSQIEYEEFIE